MLIDWTCVLDDGSRPYAPELDGDPRRPLVLRIGDDTTIRLSIVSPIGAPVDLGADINANYPQLVLRGADQRRLLAVKGARASVPGNYTIAIAAAALAPLQVQLGTFALYSIQAAAKAVLIPSSELKIGR